MEVNPYFTLLTSLEMEVGFVWGFCLKPHSLSKCWCLFIVQIQPLTVVFFIAIES